MYTQLMTDYSYINSQNAINTGNVKTSPVLNLKKQDSVSFKGYLTKLQRADKLKTFFIKLTKADLAKTDKMSKAECAKYFFDLIREQMGIPKELVTFNVEKLCKYCPRLRASASYYPIGVDDTFEIKFYEESKRSKKLGNCRIFGVLRHELEHVRQYIEIYRNKDCFPDVIENLKLKTETSLEPEKIDNFVKFLQQFRGKILEYYPETDRNCPDYKKVKQYCDCQSNYTIGNGGILNLLKYYIQPVEFDACTVQGFNWLNYLKTRLFG